MALFRKTFLKYRLGWLKSFKTGLSQDENGNYLPWMPYNLIEYLKSELKKDDRVFEYGFGTSSVFFANKVEEVISIESNRKWRDVMLSSIIPHKIENLQVILMEDALENSQYEGLSKNYEKFDWIIVDSLKREKCMKNAINAIKKDGKIILDDSQRKNYQKIRDFMTQEGFDCLEFEDIAPGQIKPKKAWVFTKSQI